MVTLASFGSRCGTTVRTAAFPIMADAPKKDGSSERFANNVDWGSDFDDKSEAGSGGTETLSDPDHEDRRPMKLVEKIRQARVLVATLRDDDPMIRTFKDDVSELEINALAQKWGDLEKLLISISKAASKIQKTMDGDADGSGSASSRAEADSVSALPYKRKKGIET